ncbi:Holliday junction resolvase RecU [Priestia filamentosa]|uniref:Holliday junction resolvase RecU n=1 Tax=Priestia filamentosa TaxID=1402861 RepID=UPI001FB43A67|nr:Holliday junction resolvase RecU [Priestia filamentosa]MED3726963.1 Holliday junction resolvase RecU [Priestia filamentosa]UOE59631.1 Holliday junction resolvase RecU [Priestia filamentosa]
MIRYPNGRAYQKAEINHTKQKGNHIYSNRGMTLEDDLNETNSYYLDHSIAVVHKKPTPIQIVNVNYPKRSAAVIKEAYFKQASTTDYNGVYKGKYLDFEAKETKNKTSFPLQNFHDHQIEHMSNVVKQNGICFVILMFSSVEEIYLYEAYHLLKWWDDMKKGGRKSIPKKSIAQDGHLIELGFQPRIPYLKVVDELYFKI